MVRGCRDLIRGEDVDADLVAALGGPGSRKFFDGSAHDDAYWLRVWGVRGLLWAWDESATDDLRDALSDDAWRVREMALKVVARHLVGDLLGIASDRCADPVARVRTAADRALAALTNAGA